MRGQFYHLLQALGAPRVPTDGAAAPVITAPPVGILSPRGALQLLAGIGGFEARGPLADVRLDLGEGVSFFAHGLVLAAGCEALRALLTGLGAPSRESDGLQVSRGRVCH